VTPPPENLDDLVGSRSTAVDGARVVDALVRPLARELGKHLVTTGKVR
jgi:hypothetical protein